MTTNDARPNPAQANRWNAWRWPTSDEISRGRDDTDLFWVGAKTDRGDATKLLREHGGGQVQWSVDGEVITVG